MTFNLKQIKIFLIFATGGGIITRIVIAGCRTFKNYNRAKEIISEIIGKNFPDEEIEIISGGCRGTDKIGERYAQEKGLKLKVYNAEWEKYGKAAGPKRNEEMAKVADYVICFWDGKSRGTMSMINLARKYKKQVLIITV